MNNIQAAAATKQLEQLKEGDKITLVIENSMGLTVVRHGRFKKALIEKYAQYQNCLKLWYTPKGKRSITGGAYPTKEIVIGKGWQDIQGQDSGNFECFDGTTFQAVAGKLLDIVYSAGQG